MSKRYTLQPAKGGNGDYGRWFIQDAHSAYQVSLNQAIAALNETETLRGVVAGLADVMFSKCRWHVWTNAPAYVNCTQPITREAIAKLIASLSTCSDGDTPREDVCDSR